MSSVGYATLQVIPSMKGTSKSITSELNGATAGAGGAAGRGIGSRMASGIGGVLKKGAIGVGVAAGGVLATALVKGWGRLTKIENATAKLSGLGNSAGTVKTIMDNALASVKGTAFGMDDAASVAAGAVASGIKPGKELTRVLKLTADAATIGGSSMGEMGAIFNKVAASGKLQGDVIAQLGDRGIPILSMLGKQIGKTPAEVSKLASQGKIDFKTFSDAMEAGLGGAALKSGETTQGAFANMQAALGRFGAQLLTGIFPLAKIVFGGIMTAVDNMTKFVGPVVEKLSAKMGEAFSRIDMAAVFAKITDVLRGLVPIAKSVFSTLMDVLPKVARSAKNLFDVVAPLAKEAFGLLAGKVHLLLPAIRGVGTVLQAVTGFMAKHKTLVQTLAVVIGTAVLAWKAWTLAVRLHGVVTRAFTAIQLACNVVMRANPIMLVVTALLALAAGLVYAYKHSETFRKIVDAAFQAVKSAAMGVVHFFTQDIPAAFMAVVGFAQEWGPLLLTAILPVIGIPLLIWQHFAQIKGFLAQVWDTVWPYLKTWGPVALAVLVPFIGIPLLIFQHFSKIKGWLAGVWSSVYGSAKTFVGNVVGAITGIPGRIAHLAGDMLKQGRAMLGGFIGGIKDAAQGAAGFIGDIFNNVAGAIKNTLNNLLHLPWKLPKIKIGAFGQYVHVGGQTMLPRLATGGMTNGPMAAMIGDNRSGKEVVMPMDSPRTISALAAALAMAGGGGSGQTNNIQISEASDPIRTARLVARRINRIGKV